MIHSDLKFVRGASYFIDHYFDRRIHHIVYINTNVPQPLTDPDLKTKQYEIRMRGLSDIRPMLSFLKLAGHYDYIMFHSLFLFTSFKCILLCHKKLLRRSLWIGFGDDLYYQVNSLKKTAYLLNGAFARYCYGYVGIFPPDCQFFKKRFQKSQAHVFYAPYLGKKPEEYDHYCPVSRLEQTLADRDCVYIQVGHSADPALGHLEVLSYLKRFSDQNIKIVLPLSYGDRGGVYADKVRKTAEEMFPGKAVCLMEFMDEAEYFEFIRRTDIAVFNVSRQQGLGNINRMIFRNVKLYLTDGSVMYRYFAGKSVPVQKVSSLRTCTFEELISPPQPVDEQAFRKFVTDMGDMRTGVMAWQRIYHHLEKTLRESERKNGPADKRHGVLRKLRQEKR